MIYRSPGVAPPDRSGGPVLTVSARTMSQSEGVDLAHALVARMALGIGARALLIKGPIAAIQELRPARVSADVDVLVEPSSVDGLCAALTSRGWHPPITREVPRILDPHSTTLVHDEWPCAIDVHRSFPGLLAPPDICFDALWAVREQYEIARQPVFAPSRSGMMLIVALHALRSPAEPRNRRELPGIRDALTNTFSEPELAQVLDVASACRSRWILNDLLRGIPGVEMIDDASPEEKRLWRLTQLDTADKSAFLWRSETVRALRTGQLSRLWRALWVRRADVPRSLVSRLPSRREHWDYQLERWKRGMRVYFRRD
ncbi:hypothetical protein QF046_001426 [Microbacterium sp. W4I4]|uniref:nucleotidyltransferase family protein n=1 Tax=Microbacterium sp. W4I4 TaxID=3042295 RepID=UPI00278665B8|nr:hypothetical protein [Microbacterium sp. W4I4]